MCVCVCVCRLSSLVAPVLSIFIYICIYLAFILCMTCILLSPLINYYEDEDVNQTSTCFKE